jgi:hypothetical protein
MTAFILYAVHTLLAVVLTLAFVFPGGLRRIITVIAASLGVAAGVAVVVLGGAELVWRTTTLSSPRAVIVGTAVACAWGLVGVLERARDPGVGALVGIASSALLVASLNDWVVPTLLFWLASSVALLALVSIEGVRTGAVLAIVGSDLLLAGSFSLHALDGRVWTIPDSISGLALGLAAAAFVVRSGALPRVGGWETLGSPAAPALPLLLGGSLAVTGVPLSGAGPWLAAGALTAAVACCLVSIAGGRMSMALAGAWPAWLSLGLVAAAPQALQPIALGGLLTLTVVSLWPATLGRARAARGLALSLLPPSAGFLAIVTGALVAFDRAENAGSTSTSLIWSAVAAMLAVALASGVALGARAASRTRSRSEDPVAAAAVWVVAAVGLCVGLLPAEVLGSGQDVVGSPTKVLVLQGAALGLGGAAALVARRRSPPSEPQLQDRIEVDTGSLSYSDDRGDVAVMLGLAVLIALGTLGTVGYLTLEGLSYGFLPPSNL